MKQCTKTNRLVAQGSDFNEGFHKGIAGRHDASSPSTLTRKTHWLNQALFSGVAMLVMTSFMVSCGTTAPIKQRDEALASIERAQTVEALIYAQGLFANAQQNYDEGNELIVEEKKSKQNTKAKTLYVEATTLASNAYDEAIGPFTQAIIDETAVQLETARTEKVDRASENLYAQAVTENTDAATALATNEYAAAKDTSLTARQTLQAAIAETKRLRAIIDEQQTLIASLNEEALQMKATNATPTEYQSNVSSMGNVSEVVTEGYYPQAIEDGKELIESFKALLVLIEEKRKEAIQELANAERTIEKLQSDSVTVDNEIKKLNEQYQGQ
ncbi:hypothetical protein COTS27_01542 [Spirochaetota bacterium]|nr:hypothetical protein COTS27_01542 [Spirochaetota bacterium]